MRRWAEPAPFPFAFTARDLLRVGMPRRFRFRLERVLDLRRQKEDQAKLAFGKALSDHTAQAARVDALRLALAEHEAKLYSGKETTAADLWLWRRYQDRLVSDVEKAEIRLMDLARVLTQRRREMIERSKERKLLEQLRNQQEISFRREENLREQREYDEMATLRYAHGRQ
jgi:flagellar protein FliJ